MTDLGNPNSALTPEQAAAFHNQPEGVNVAWFAIPGSGGAGVIARAHTEAHDGGRRLPEHLITADFAALQTLMPGSVSV